MTARAIMILRMPSVLLFCSLMAAGQSGSSSLRVEVVDPSGATIAGAKVAVGDTAMGFATQSWTASDGDCLFAQLPSGSYAVSVEAAGFARQAKQIMLLVNQPATLAIRLTVQSANTDVEVKADASALNHVEASMGNAVENETIEALPMEGRNVSDLLGSEPGVLYLGSNNNQSYDSRSGSTAGGRSDQGDILLDGVDNNDRLNGFAFTGALRSPLDSVDEFRVATAGYGAGSGHSSGAQINLSTRSGSNSLHAGVYEYNRSSLGEANDWFNKQAELNSGLPNRAGKLIRNTFGFFAGGPIKQNRAYYFVNYEGQRTAEDLQQTQIVPTSAMRLGSLQYLNGSGGTTSLDSAQIATMDPGCGANGTCPWGPGVNPNVMVVLNQYPLPNGTVAGDGLNTASYTWPAPDPAALNTYVARFDYLPSAAHLIFVRGTLENDSGSGAPQFPGEQASMADTGNSKGFAIGDLWNLSPRVTNNFHYGYTRQGSASRGIGHGPYANFYNIATLDAETRTTVLTAPTHNLASDLSWIKDAHTIQFGVNYRLIHSTSQSDALSYNYGYTNAYALMDAGIAGTGQSLDPAAFQFPAVAGSFADSYSFAAANLTGLMDLVTDQANYRVDNSSSGAGLLSQGAMLDRTFRNNEFESYVEDSWRAHPGLTITAGLRYSLLQSPFEVHGQQVQPTVDIAQWFATRGEQARLGNSVQPDLYFAPSGQSRGMKPYWPMQTLNFAPHLAMAYVPAVRSGFWRALLGGADKSVIRAGYGVYYDHYGAGVVHLFDQTGSFGLSESTTNPTNVLTPDTSPRFTGLHNLPQITAPAADTISYPALAPNDPLGDGFAIAHGIDDRLKTPYAHGFDFSMQREFPGAFTLEVAYIGRLGRHLLQQIDLAEPLDLVDPVSGQDYFTAASELSRQKYAGAAQVAAIPYFEDMFPDAAQSGESATQSIYDSVWYPGNETGSLYMLDVLCTPGCGGKTNRFWTRQYASLYAWSSLGSSSYNAAQITLLRRMSHGLEMNLGYTLSKSIDLGSDTERTQFSSSTGTAAGSSFSAIVNSWSPRLNRAVSDFDVRHLLTADWVAELPVGRGKALLGSINRRMDGVVGGWSLAGLTRWSSGLPFSLVSGAGWGTDWDEKSNMIQTGSIRTHTHLVNGEPQVFADPSTVLAHLRNPYPGEAGQRNNFRGDGYIDVDSSLSKKWKLGESGSLRFAWEVFNVSNSVRFDVNPITSLQNMTTSGELGVYGATLTKPRVEQFSLRYSY